MRFSKRMRGFVSSFGLLAATMSFVPGCGLFLSNALMPGTYAGDLACVIRVTDASGAEAEEEFTSSPTVTVGEDGGITVDGVRLAVGASVTRAIPNADLAFEVTRIRDGFRRVVVRFAPRPTLPGITVEGELREIYRRDADAIQVTAGALLNVGDIDGVTPFDIRCNGRLSRQ